MKKLLLLLLLPGFASELAAQTQKLSKAGYEHYVRANLYIEEAAKVQEIDPQAHKFEQAAAELEKALATDPKSAAVHFNMAVIYRNIGTLRKDGEALNHALMLIDEVEKLAPGNAQAVEERVKISHALETLTTERIAAEEAQRVHEAELQRQQAATLAEQKRLREQEQRIWNNTEFHRMFNVGVKLHAGISDIIQSDEKIIASHTPGFAYSIGASIEFRPLKRLAIEVDALYTPFRIGKSTGVEGSSPTIIRYLDVPIMLNVYLGRHQWIYLSAGYQLGFRLGAKVEGLESSQAKELFAKTNGSVYFAVNFKPLKFFTFHIGGTMGVRDIMNPEMEFQGTMKTLNVFYGFGYRF